MNAVILPIVFTKRLSRSFLARLPRRPISFGFAPLCVLLLTFHYYNIFVGLNWHTVEEGKLYRSAQPSSGQLQQKICELGIRTVINLRGQNYGRTWYDEEKRIAEAHGVAIHDVNFFSANQMPHKKILLRIIDLFDNAPKPILVHCQGGSDRSGLASAIYLLLINHDLDSARGQLSFKFGYLGFGYKERMQFIFNDYEEWLAEHSYLHAPNRFRHWAKHVYDPPKDLVYPVP